MRLKSLFLAMFAVIMFAVVLSACDTAPSAVDQQEQVGEKVMVTDAQRAALAAAFVDIAGKEPVCELMYYVYVPYDFFNPGAGGTCIYTYIGEDECPTTSGFSPAGDCYGDLFP